jgi:predicted dehydrogenase
MRLLVVGLGSMGKRRVRCLHALGVTDIVGVDTRADRRDEAGAAYGIAVHESLDAALLREERFDAAILSVPPQAHVQAMRVCLVHHLPFFVEASVVDDGLAEVIDEVARTALVAAPSATLGFHPAIREISRIVRDGHLGKVSNVLLHSGQYLPDWHTYEDVSEYYVSTPATGGAREIVPFEMTWFTALFGFPRRVAANYRKTIDIAGAGRIDDTYNCLLDYGSWLASVTVDVVSRNATRRLVINGSRQQLIWSWEQPVIRVFDGQSGEWMTRSYQMESSAPGYNKNIGENMYIEETGAFLAAVRGEAEFPNTLAADHRVLKLLFSFERADRIGSFVEI